MKKPERAESHHITPYLMEIYLNNSENFNDTYIRSVMSLFNGKRIALSPATSHHITPQETT